MNQWKSTCTMILTFQLIKIITELKPKVQPQFEGQISNAVSLMDSYCSKRNRRK